MKTPAAAESVAIRASIVYLEGMTSVMLPRVVLVAALVFIVVDIVSALVSPAFYHRFMTGELGVIENLQVLALAAALVLNLRLLARGGAIGPRGLRVWLWLFVFGLVYVLGEEISWGQHYMGWQAEGWFARVNDQMETNLHNTSSWFDQKPRALLLICLGLGGAVAPLWEQWRKRQLFRLPGWLMPTRDNMPLALLVMAVQLPEIIEKTRLLPFSLMIPNLRFSELQELLLYCYFLAYLGSIAARYGGGGVRVSARGLRRAR